MVCVFPVVSALVALSLRLVAIPAIAVLAVTATAAGVVWQANGVPACSVVSPQESPYAACVGSGETIVVWADARGLDYDIYAQKLDSAGNPLWAVGGVKICGADYDQMFPAAVDDGAGGAIVIWQDGRLGDDGLDIYAQRLTPGGAVAWQADGVSLCSHESGLADPPMAFSHVVTGDGSGGAIVAWRDTRNDPVNGNTEIYAQSVDGSGAARWTTNGVKILGFSTRKWSTRTPVIAPDGSGGAIVAWQDARDAATTGNDLYIQRVTSAGVLAWAANGVVVCDAIGEQGYPDIVGMSEGSAAIVWDDRRSGNYDVYAQRFDASGSSQWGADGRAICSSSYDQRTPRVCSDGSGGLVVAWTDKRNGTAYTDIYAQRLDSSGFPLWENQGVAVCTAAGFQTRIRMVPSVSGLSILTWMDTRNETIAAAYDLYGQMIDSSATPSWAPAGVPVAAITGNNQRMQQVAGDGVGSLFAVWEDDRNAGDWDIFAQKLSPWSAVGSIAEAKSQSLGSLISLPARVVTGSFPGCFYIEDADRCAGIRVLYPAGLAPGSRVAVSGTVELDPEPTVRASVVISDGVGEVPGALGITVSRLGSQLIGDVPGLANTGLLIRTWGRVVSKQGVDQPYMVLADGAREVRVYSTAGVEIGDTVVVTGVCSGEPAPSGTVVSVLTRDASDVRWIGQ